MPWYLLALLGFHLLGGVACAIDYARDCLRTEGRVGGAWIPLLICWEVILLATGIAFLWVEKLQPHAKRWVWRLAGLDAAEAEWRLKGPG